MFKSIVCMNGLLTSLHCLSPRRTFMFICMSHLAHAFSAFYFFICSFISPSVYLSICLPFHLYLGSAVYWHAYLSFVCILHLLGVESARLIHALVDCMYEWFVDKPTLSVSKENIHVRMLVSSCTCLFGFLFFYLLFVLLFHHLSIFQSVCLFICI